MTLNSSNKYSRSRSARPERLSVRASKSAPFGSSSTRPPTSPAPDDQQPHPRPRRRRPSSWSFAYAKNSSRPATTQAPRP